MDRGSPRHALLVRWELPSCAWQSGKVARAYPCRFDHGRKTNESSQYLVTCVSRRHTRLDLIIRKLCLSEANSSPGHLCWHHIHEARQCSVIRYIDALWVHYSVSTLQWRKSWSSIEERNLLKWQTRVCSITWMSIIIKTHFNWGDARNISASFFHLQLTWSLCSHLHSHSQLQKHFGR